MNSEQRAHRELAPTTRWSRFAHSLREVAERWGALLVLFGAPVLGLATHRYLLSRLEEAKLDTSDDFLVWLHLFTYQVIVWAVLAGIGMKACLELRADLDRWLAEPVPLRRTAAYLAPRLASLVVSLTLVVLASRSPDDSSLASLRWSVLWLAAVAGLAALPAMWVLADVRTVARAPHSWSTAADDLMRLRSLRALAISSTVALGVIVAMHVLAYGAFRQALDASGLRAPPEGFVLLYGAFLTAWLAGTYWEVVSALDQCARRLIERAAPLPTPSGVPTEEFTSIRKLRSEIAAEVSLGPDLRTQLVAGVGIAFPLLGVVASGLTGIGE